MQNLRRILKQPMKMADGGWQARQDLANAQTGASSIVAGQARTDAQAQVKALTPAANPVTQPPVPGIPGVPGVTSTSSMATNTLRSPTAPPVAFGGTNTYTSAPAPATPMPGGPITRVGNSFSNFSPPNESSAYAPAFSLGMADGGMLDGVKRMIGMGPPETMTQKFARQDAERAAKMPVPAPAPIVAPQTGISGYVGNNTLQRREAAAGLRDGGMPYRKGCADGGKVVGPGTGISDSVPARYSNGEYVLPADTAEHIGYNKLDAIKDATHTPAAAQRGLRNGGNDVQENRESGHESGNGAMAGKSGGAGVHRVGMGNSSAGLNQSLRLVDGGRLEPYANFRTYDGPPAYAPGSAVGPANYRPNFTMPAPDAVIGDGPASKGFDTSRAADAAPAKNFFQRAAGAALRPGETLANAGTAAGNAMKTAGSALGDAGTATGKLLKGAVGPALRGGSNFLGALPHAAVYADDNVPLSDKFQIGATDLSRGVGTAAGGVFGGAVGTAALPVAGSITGAIGGGIAGDYLGHKAGNFIFNGDAALRRNGYDPERNLVDSAKDAIAGKSANAIFGGQGPQAGAGRGFVNPTGTEANTSAYNTPGADATMPGQDPGRNAPTLRSAPPPEAAPTAPGMNPREVMAMNNQMADRMASERMAADEAARPMPGPKHSGNDWQTRNALRNMEVSASSIMGSTKERMQRQAAFQQAQGNDMAVMAGADPASVAAIKARTDMAQNAITRRGQDMTQQTTLRGQDVTERDNARNNDTSLRNNKMNNDFNAGKFGVEISQKDREFGAARDAEKFAQREASRKAMHDEIAGMLPPGVDGKPDLATAARYSTALNADLAAKQGILERDAKANKPGAAAALADFEKNGRGVADEAYKGRFIAGMAAKDAIDQGHTGRLTPYGGTSTLGNAPVARLKETGKGFLGFNREYTGYDAAGNKVGTTPARNIEGDGSFIFGKARNDLRTLIQK